jgi:hypothetical protein
MANLIPVDHDPFIGVAAAAPTLIPVDDDPFVGAAATAPTVVSVDHDPFAAPSSAPDASPLGPNPQPNIADTATSNALPAAPPDLSAASPNRFADFFSLLPPSEVDPTASRSPIFLSPNPFSPGNLPASIWPTKAPIFLNSPGQSPLLENAPAKRPAFDPTRSLLGPMPTAQPANSDASYPSPGPAPSASELEDQPPARSRLQGSANSSPLAPDSTFGDADAASGRPSDSPFGSDGQTSATRVVRDSAGHIAAIIHVRPASSDEMPSVVLNDASQDAPRPTKIVQFNNAITPNPVINRTTDILLWALEQSVAAMGSGFGARFGTAVHVDFANRVRKLDLPGIGQTGVEQTFHPEIPFNPLELLKYGLAGSVRTDVTLKDPKDPYQRPIAIYDLKTGDAVLRPSRAQELREGVQDQTIPIIVLRYKTIEAVLH